MAEGAAPSKMNLGLNRAMILITVLAPLFATVFALVTVWTHPWVSGKDLALLGVFFMLTALGVTVGYHRMHTHGSFKTNPIIRGILLIFGMWAVQGAPTFWAAIHLKHHVHSDKDEDPHSPLKGLFHAHVGWLLTPQRAELGVYAKSQMEDPVARFLGKTAFWWTILTLLLPLAIGGWTGLLWGGFVRVFLMHHVTWSVNSVCHAFGSRGYKTRDRSTNNWLVGIVALGEGWHNNHHAFPRSAFHGLSWRQPDVSGYVIRLMSWLGLATNVYSVPRNVVVSRRLPSGRKWSFRFPEVLPDPE